MSPARACLRFWRQPRREYRDFQLVYGALALHFLFPALGYLLDPEWALESFLRLGRILGGGDYPVPEKSYVWRVLAGTNVLTLAFLCAFIQADVRRHWAALYPLVFMKGATALSYLAVYLAALSYPAFAAIAAWDGLNCAAFVFFARRARRAAQEDESVLIPRPLGFRAYVAVAALALLVPSAKASPGLTYRTSELPDPRVERLLKRHFKGDAEVLDLRLRHDPTLKGTPGSFRLDLATGPRREARLYYGEASGAYYGVLALRDLTRRGPLEAMTLEERPGFRWRGVMEGFYGRPWSWETRRRMAAWMSRRRMNLLVLAPKDDERLRASWRRPLEPDYLRELKDLRQAAREGFVELAWALSPGLDLRPSSRRDLAAAVSRYEAVLAQGLQKLVLAFDDTPPRPGHADFANAVLKALSARFPDVEMTFVPALYWGEAAPSPYLDYVARRLDSRFKVGWTGPGILCRRISRKDAARFKSLLRHPLVLGDNYPVQDRLLDSGRLFLGPLAGRDPGLAPEHEAFVANASPLAELSKISLATAADYAWDPAGYDASASWERSLRDAAASEGGEPRIFAAEALRHFALHNAVSWVEPVPLSGQQELSEAVGSFWLGSGTSAPYGAVGRARARGALRRLEALPGELEAKLSPELSSELRPWAQALGSQAAAALAGLELWEAMGGGRASKPLPSPPALKARWSRLRHKAARSPAVVADQALDRFLNGLELALSSGKPGVASSLRALLASYRAGAPGAGEALKPGLDRLIQAPARLEAAAQGQAELAHELLPWVSALAWEAGRVRAALERPEPGPQSWPRRWCRRWRVRTIFLSLLASRALMEDFLDRRERAFLPGKALAPRRGLPWGLRLWLSWRKLVYPRSFPALLARQLEAPGAARPELADSFRMLSRLASDLRLAGLPEELLPWLHKLEGYGSLGVAALELERGLSGLERSAWARDRQRLGSGNGLELCLELWRRLEAFPGPGEMPADPSEI